MFIQKMDKGDYNAAHYLSQNFRIPRELLIPAAKRAYEMNRNLGYINQANDLKQRYFIQENGIISKLLSKMT